MKSNMMLSNILFFVMFCAGSLVTGNLLAQSRFNVSLLVNDQDRSYTAYHDQPVVFTISMMNLLAYEDQRWNRRADLAIGELEEAYKKGKMKREEYEKEKKYLLDNKRPLHFDKLGTEENPWYAAIKFSVVKDGKDTVQLPFRLMKEHQPAKLVVLDTINSFYVLYGISPEDLAKQQAGSYEIHAEIAGVQSGKVVMDLLPEKLSQVQWKTEVVQMQFANYYLHEPDLQKALIHAENILSNDSCSITGLMLRGEIRIRTFDYSKALRDFERALIVYNTQGNKEAPEYIIGMIEGVRQKMARQKY